MKGSDVILKGSAVILKGSEVILKGSAVILKGASGFAHKVDFARAPHPRFAHLLPAPAGRRVSIHPFPRVPLAPRKRGEGAEGG